MVGTNWECDLSAVCAGTPAEAYAVTSYQGVTSSDYDAWGTCGAFSFCCAHVEVSGSPIYEVDLTGSDKEDILGFTYPSSTKLDNLQPARSHDIMGVIHGLANPDHGGEGGPVTEYIYGSDFVGNSYSEQLFGDEDRDVIYGNGDGDFIYGGSGDDECYGGGGNDHIDGGSGDDQLYGGNDNDVLCDTGCATPIPLLQILSGDNGTNTIWYYGDALCATPPLSANGGAASVHDECGDYAFWGWPPANWSNCDVQLNVKPSFCPI